MIPIMGGDELEKLNIWLKEMNALNLETVHAFYSAVFGDLARHLQARFDTLVKDNGTWPTVGFASILVSTIHV